MNALTNAGVVSGFGDGSYRADAPVTRGEMSKFIFNFLSFAGAPGIDARGQDYFSDDDGSVFEADLNADASVGFYVGSPGPNGNELARPNETAPRDQMAGFIARIVEFAVDELKQGRDLVSAALEGARRRLRPILMTSFAFILGCVPLYIATGSGAQARRILGTIVVTGMLAATVLAVFVIPLLFVVVERIARRRWRDEPEPPTARVSDGSSARGDR